MYSWSLIRSKHGNERRKRLKGTRFSIDRDYPSEIAEARKKLWPEVKRLRGIPGQNVQLQFSARMVLNGLITKDAFPPEMKH